MGELPMVAIVGRPNVGKSSLFNRLLGRRRAIVAKEAGTTRDSVQDLMRWQGKDFWLVDTAGLGLAEADIATDIQTQIAEAKAAAQVIVVVVEAANPVTPADRQAAKAALKTGKPILLAVNKIDRTKDKLPDTIAKLGIKQTVAVSAVHGRGTSELLDLIAKLVPKTKAAKTAARTLAIVGRPNVGKSSLFNAMIGAPKALVAKQAGTTRDVNLGQIKIDDETYQIMDTGGIRRPGKRQPVEQFSYLRTMQAVNACDVAAVVIDATEPSVALDQRIAGLVKEAGKGLVLVINKWDLVEATEQARASIEQRLQNDFAFCWWAPVVFASAVTGSNVSKIIELAKTIIKHRATKVKTSQLNVWLQATTTKHPPAGVRRYQPKLRYVTQTGIEPPQFAFFGSNLDLLHWSYQRYLEAQLRQSFELGGTPIRLQYREKAGVKSK
ncbi:ribosome biogenesis GTPase Der [Candidatus Microgenomates bacterium]|nr:ribosome biogenesis GTPase Der [Candidatus Microgenomates bacterium]